MRVAISSVFVRVDDPHLVGTQKRGAFERSVRMRRKREEKTIREKSVMRRSYAAFCPNLAYIYEQRE